MKRSLFSGWQDVFSFTLKQAAGEKFRKTTILLAVIMLIVGMAVSVIMAFVQKKDAVEISPIETVHVIDESGLDLLYLEGFQELYAEDFPYVVFVTEQKAPEELAVSLGEQAPRDVILQITASEEGYLLTVVLPFGTEIKEGQGEKLNEAMTMVMEQSKLLSSGIPMEKLIYVMSQVNTSYLDAGEEEKSIGEELTTMLFPMVVSFVIYYMVLIYGQSIGNIVSVEKSSKLMEMLLTLTRPYGIILGKISAMVVTAIFQMLLWIASVTAGFFLGDYIAGHMIYPGYVNYLLQVFELLKNQGTAFSVGAMLLAIFTVCISFLFYSVLAGMIASFAGKAEELAQVMAYYQIIMMAGFFLSYLRPFWDEEWIHILLYLIPVTSAYLLPGDLVVGNITALQGTLYLLVLVAVTFVLIIFTGRVYQNQLFYQGKSLQERLRFQNHKRVHIKGRKTE
ncbi:MAG: ABC transporter permease [Roseburia sp.]|nr:ABC transporter permease [Roseburia sp.]